MRHPYPIVGILGFAALQLFAADPPGPLTTQQELASFRLADDQLVIELVASEPNVVSPVAIAWDADGRLFVAEMSDYPNSRDKGRIKLLEDRDRDGRYERAVVFADQLPFPNGVLPWKNGLLVTAAPDIWFLSDTNGDGVADIRQRILTGFAEGNQQLRVNGLFIGLDNWIYGANGRSDGEVRWADEQGAKEKPVSIRGHDFRFRVDSRQFETVAGRCQFGNAHDDWGNRFLSWNTSPIRHEVLPERYLNRNRFLAATESVFDILEPGDTGRVYPLTPPPLTFNNESVSHFNALAGLAIYRGDALGERYRGNAFVGESLRNLVHRRIIEPSGPTFVARRAEKEKEFLASTDPWFHPVNYATGPDGALYIVDFYRRFVEHPDFVRGNARNETSWRTGAEHGRIWRVRLKNSSLENRKIDLSTAGIPELVQEMESSNGWRRDTVQRVLTERHDVSAQVLLDKLVRSSARPESRVQALYTLNGLEILTSETLAAALKDADARVRANAVKLAGDLIPQSDKNGNLDKILLGLVEDSNAAVRFQVALALGELKDSRKFAALAVLADRDFTNRWHSLAMLSSLGQSPWSFLRELVGRNENWLKAATPDQAQFLDEVAKLIGTNNHKDRDLEEFYRLMLSATKYPAARFALMAGFEDGLNRAGLRLHREGEPVDPMIHYLSPPISPEVASAVADGSLHISTRLAALRVLVRIGSQSSTELTVLRLLRSNQPPELQSAAAAALGQLNDPHVSKAVFTDWNQYPIRLRRQLASAATRSIASTTALIEALENRTISAIELEASTRQTLQKVQDVDLKRRVSQLFQDTTATDRAAVVQSLQPALKLAGNLSHGAAIFAKSCLVCHTMQGQGSQVGPDLSGISSRPGEALLIDIADPGRQVSPDFINYSVVTTAGESLSGLIAAETAASFTIRRQGQPDTTVLRNQIKELRAEGKSLMPDGLEQGLTHQDIADLLEFLRRPDATLLPK